MQITQTKVTSKGQTTIPNWVRKIKDIKNGGAVNWYMDQRGRVFVGKPKKPVELMGILKKNGKKVVEKNEWRETYADYIASKYNIRKKR